MKPGRKSAWTTKIEPRLVEIAAWARDGYTDAQISEALTIHIDTFYKYKKLKTEMSDALKINKAIADLTVENSLFKRALGYEYDEKTTEARVDAEGNITSKHVKTVKKQVVADTTAQIFWLKNRKPREWRDKIQVENNVSVKLESIEDIEEEMKRRGIPIPQIGIEDLED